MDKLGNLQSRNIQSNISPGYAKSTDKRLFSTAVRAKHEEVPEASNTPEMSIKVASMMIPRHVSLNPNPKKSSIKRIELPAIYAERLGKSPSLSKLSNSPSNLDLKDYNQTSQAEFSAKKGRSKRKRQSSVLPAHVQDPSQSNPLTTQDPRSHSPQSNTLPKIKIKKKALGHTFETRRHSQLKPQQSYNIEAIKKIQNLMTSPSARKLKYSPSKISIKSQYKRNHRK